MTIPLEQTSLPYSRLHHFSPLFSDYCTDFRLLAHFFERDYRSVKDLRSAAEEICSVSRDRDALVDILLEQNGNWQPDGSYVDQLEKLRRPDAIAVVTGQQLGLFGGPSYTIYKAITAVKMARDLELTLGRPVAPVFWLEGEDHDLDEVGRVSVFRGNDPIELRYGEGDENRQSVGKLHFTEEITAIIATIEDLWPPTEFRDEVVSLMRTTYQPGRSFYDAFASFMAALFRGTGLVFVCPDDQRLKDMARTLFAREIEDGEESNRRLHQTGDELERDYHAQVRTKPLNLFLFHDDERLPLDSDGTIVRVRGTDTSYSIDELKQLVNEHPERFSPNVVMRPLYQDTVLPTAVYVAGPGEVAYFAQYRPLYEWAGIPMPAILPRLSMTYVEPKVQKVMRRYGLSVGDFGTDADALFKRVVSSQMDIDLESIGTAVKESVGQALDPIVQAAQEIDPTLKGAAGATAKNIARELDKLTGRILKAEKRKHETISGQLEKASSNLAPFGKPQERVVSILQYLVRYGTGFVQDAVVSLPIETQQHHVIYLR